MNPLLIVFMMFLGLMAPAAVADPAIFPGGYMDMGHNNKLAARKELADRQAMAISHILKRLQIKCALDRKNTGFVPGMPGTFMSSAWCAQYFTCNIDGTKFQSREPSTENQYVDELQDKINWCKEWCECVPASEPKKHWAYNYGCMDSQGNIIASNIGSTSRDLDSAKPPGEDGLTLQAAEGPARKE